MLGLVRASRARRSFDASRLLARARIRVAAPLACIEDGGRAWFVARFVEGRPLDPLEEGAEAARLAARIHTAGVEHGDFKPQNLIVASERIVALDLDAARIHGGVPPRRARARDLGALVAYAERIGASVASRDEMVAAYLDAAPFENDPASFERAVLARSRVKLARWAGA
jgi:tRNA A-37 threonylcarbamoyl transferase component Bud32